MTFESEGTVVPIFDRIKFDGLRNRDWLIYKHPNDNLVFGSQLIVGQGQVAVFVRGGQICDSFASGTYTLDTSNLPVLNSLLNAPFGGKTPFSAEIFFINTTAKLDINWGTSDPIQLVDPKYFVKLRVRAFGQMGLRLADHILFFRQLIGTMNFADVVRFDKTLDFFKGILIQKMKTIIADIIINQKISALELTARLDEISGLAQGQIEREFTRFGFQIVNFFIKSINIPDEDFAQINDILKNRAEFEIMGDTRYVTKRSFDVYDHAASNENGAAGAFAAGGIGLGAGVALGNAMGQTVRPGAVLETPQAECPHCHAKNPADAVFCSSCGKAIQPPARFCPACKAQIPQQAKFCPACGAPVGLRKCGNCGAELPSDAKFCPSCGKDVSADDER